MNVNAPRIWTLSSIVLLIALSLAFFLPGIASVPITDRDSAHFAQASRQMLLDHNYWTIRFQNNPRHLKPPGIYWLHTASVKLFSTPNSVRVWPYTLVSVFGGLLAVLLTFAYTRSFYANKIAFLAALLLAACPLLIIESHLIVTDSMLLATMVLMQGALWRLYHSQRAGQKPAVAWVLFFWLGMSAGILIKGITPLVAGLTILSICLWDRNRRWLKVTRWWWGLPLTVLCTLAWLLPLSLATHSNFLMDMFKQDALPKIVGGQQSHGMPPGFFTLLFSGLFWPGALFIGYTIRFAWQQRQHAHIRFLVAWILPTWISFELMPTKLPEYVLPTFPAIAILTALTVSSLHKEVLSPLARALICMQYTCWVLMGGVIMAVMIAASYFFAHQLLPAAVGASTVLLMGIIMALLAIKCKHWWFAAISSSLGMSLACMLFLQNVVPQLHSLWVSQTVVDRIQSFASRSFHLDQPLLTLGYNEPSLVFLLGKDQVKSISVASFSNRLKEQPTRIEWVLVNQKQWDILQQLIPQIDTHFQSVSTIQGFNYSKGRWITLYLLKRVK